MAPTLFTFAIVFAIVLGGYWLFVLRLEDQAQSTLRRRLKGNTVRQKARLAILKETQRLSHLDFLERFLRRNEQLMSGLQRLIEQADVKMSPGLFVLTSAVLAVSAYLLVSIF